MGKSITNQGAGSGRFSSCCFALLRAACTAHTSARAQFLYVSVIFKVDLPEARFVVRWAPMGPHTKLTTHVTSCNACGGVQKEVADCSFSFTLAPLPLLPSIVGYHWATCGWMWQGCREIGRFEGHSCCYTGEHFLKHTAHIGTHRHTAHSKF